MVSTLDSEYSDPSSNLGRSYELLNTTTHHLRMLAENLRSTKSIPDIVTASASVVILHFLANNLKIADFPLPKLSTISDEAMRNNQHSTV
jgi:hypothetical protein